LKSVIYFPSLTGFDSGGSLASQVAAAAAAEVAFPAVAALGLAVYNL
jgi:hypothetical protein